MNEDQNRNQLPKDWKRVKLEEVCLKITDGSHFSPKSVANGYPYVTVRDIKNDKINFDDCLRISKSDYESLVQNDCKPLLNDVLFSKDGTVGKVSLINFDFNFVILSSLAILRTDTNKIIPKYLFYILKSRDFLHQALKQKKGVAIRRIILRDLKEINLNVTALEPQRRIVSKIEELFSELDKGIENLRVAQQQLKTYRQSVLKWAFEGKATNEKVKEGELPAGWKLTKLGEYIADISSGKSYRCDERPPNKNELGIVKVSSVTWGFFNEMESKTCFSKDFLNEKYLIKNGDFLFSRANTIELIGACVLVHKIDKTLMLSDKILRFTFSKDVLKEFALYYLRSRQGRKQIEMLSTGNQDSMRNIGQEKIRQIEFPFCSIEEQQNIVQAIESRLSLVDKMDECITQSLQQAEALRQSILKKAFEGMLIS